MIVTSASRTTAAGQWMPGPDSARHQEAHQLERANPGWQVWVGDYTKDFLALHPAVPGLVVRRTAVEMARFIWGRELARREPECGGTCTRGASRL